MKIFHFLYKAMVSNILRVGLRRRNGTGGAPDGAAVPRGEGDGAACAARTEQDRTAVGQKGYLPLERARRIYSSEESLSPPGAAATSWTRLRATS